MKMQNPVYENNSKALVELERSETDVKTSDCESSCGMKVPETMNYAQTCVTYRTALGKRQTHRNH